MKQNKKDIVIEIGNYLIRCSLNFQNTASFFHGFIKENENVIDNITIDNYDEALWSSTGKELNAYGEYSLLSGAVSDCLLKYNSCLIHAVAFKYKNKAYLIAAPPETGKTTQILHLMKLYPDQFSIICGDRPCLSINNRGIIIVYPTPWNGKEGLYGNESCELGAMFFLSRGKVTSIVLDDTYSAVFHVFSSLISRRETEESIQALGKMTEYIVSHYPVYNYVNGGVPESTKYFYETIFKEVEDDSI